MVGFVFMAILPFLPFARDDFNTGEAIFAAVFFGLMSVSNAYFAMASINWKIELREDDFVYTNALRKQTVYKYSEVEVRPVLRVYKGKNLLVSLVNDHPKHQYFIYKLTKAFLAREDIVQIALTMDELYLLKRYLGLRRLSGLCLNLEVVFTEAMAEQSGSKYGMVGLHEFNFLRRRIGKQFESLIEKIMLVASEADIQTMIEKLNKVSPSDNQLVLVIEKLLSSTFPFGIRNENFERDLPLRMWQKPD